MARFVDDFLIEMKIAYCSYLTLLYVTMKRSGNGTSAIPPIPSCPSSIAGASQKPRPRDPVGKTRFLITLSVVERKGINSHACLAGGSGLRSVNFMK
jgi:hypothetical protein